MGHFAKCNNGIVEQVIVATEAFFDNFVDTSPGTWVKCSYNTRGGIHYVPNSNPPEPSSTQEKALRANYAGIGYTYNPNYTLNGSVGVFYAPQPYPSWVLNTTTFLWEAPVAMPTTGGPYVWDEATQSWVAVPTV